MNRIFPKWIDFMILTVALFLIAHTFDAPLYYGNLTSWAQYGEAAGTGTISKQSGFIILFAYGLFACFEHRKDIFFRKTLSLGLAIAFLVTITLSIIWSVDRNASLVRLFGFVSFVLAGLGATKRLGGEGVIRWYVFAQFSILIIGFIDELVLLTFTPLSPGYRFGGTSHPNGTGTDAAILAFSSIAMLRLAPSSRFYRTTLFTAIVLLLLTRSRTALIETIFGLMIVYGIASLRGIRLGLYLYGLALLASLPFILRSVDVFDVSAALSLGRDDSSHDALTGRMPLWTELYNEYIDKRPIIGYGYGAFWTPQRIEDISADQQWAIAAAHSAYLDAALSIGFPGAMLYLGVLLSLLAQSLGMMRRGKPEGFFFSCLLCALLFDGFTESEPWYLSSIYLFASIQATFVTNLLTVKSTNSSPSVAAPLRLNLLKASNPDFS